MDSIRYHYDTYERGYHQAGIYRPSQTDQLSGVAFSSSASRPRHHQALSVVYLQQRRCWRMKYGPEIHAARRSQALSITLAEASVTLLSFLKRCACKIPRQVQGDEHAQHQH